MSRYLNMKLLRQVLGIGKRKSITVCKNNRGTVRMSYRALESLAERKIAQLKSVRKVKVTVVTTVLGAGMLVHITVSPGDNITSLVTRIKETVRDEITTLTGIRLQKVQVVKRQNSSRSRVR